MSVLGKSIQFPHTLPSQPSGLLPLVLLVPIAQTKREARHLETCHARKHAHSFTSCARAKLEKDCCIPFCTCTYSTCAVVVVKGGGGAWEGLLSLECQPQSFVLEHYSSAKVRRVWRTRLVTANHRYLHTYIRTLCIL